MGNHDWSKFESKTYVNASPEKVFKAWATQKGLESWFLKKASMGNRKPTETVQSGDDYSWTWYTADDYTDSGKIIETQSPNYLRFSFGVFLSSQRVSRSNHHTRIIRGIQALTCERKTRAPRSRCEKHPDGWRKSRASD